MGDLPDRLSNWRHDKKWLLESIPLDVRETQTVEEGKVEVSFHSEIAEVGEEEGTVRAARFLRPTLRALAQ